MESVQGCRCLKSTLSVVWQGVHSEPWPRILGLILVKGWSFDYALFGEDLTMVLVKSWSYPSQRLVTLTNRIVKRYLKRGRSKVSQVDYPLTSIRLIISGQYWECSTLVLRRWKVELIVWVSDRQNEYAPVCTVVWWITISVHVYHSHSTLKKVEPKWLLSGKFWLNNCYNYFFLLRYW